VLGFGRSLSIDRIASDRQVLKARRPTGDVDERWVSSRLWPASSGLAFQSIRTNNDGDGCHNRLNQQARGGSSTSALMFREADFVRTGL